MAVSEFERSWFALADILESRSDYKTLGPQQSDIEHLEKLGGHKALIDLARKRPNVGALNIAPSRKDREFSPDWMFKNSIPIGSDGCGNYVLWMDVSTIDSPILLICHDPAEVVVLSQSPTEFFDNIRLHLSLYKGSNQHGVLYDYVNNWKIQTKNSSEIVHHNKSERDIFDFSAAKVGDSIALDFRGKDTIVIEGYRPGVLILGTEVEDVLERIRRRDRNWTVGFLILVGIVFSFFYIVLNKSILASFGNTLFILFTIFSFFMLTIDSYYIWREKRRGET